jgi:tetratricopeptide (TPR) repeat protein
VPDVLRLEAREFTDLTRWRWVLTDSAGAFVADHEVRLEANDWQYEAFTDLRRYVSWHADPGERYAEDEARIVADVGTWIGGQVLGDTIAKALARNRNATARVILPPAAEALAYIPLETAHAAGKPLTAHGITLIIETAAAGAPSSPAEIRDRLRVLGLFSLPEGGSPLSLRRERHELVNLIRGLAANGRAAEVKVLQYGVTRDRLQDILEDADGWDIIHISGHGAPGELLLETANGTLDRITAAELADMLATARDHVKLVTVTACWSAALSAAEQRRLLRVPVQDNQSRAAERLVAAPPAPAPPAALATKLADRLDCTVLAMRYPVNDAFAIELSGKLYDLLTRQGQPLPRAVALTLKHLGAGADGTGRREFPALSMAAPAVFGPTAVGLTLAAPRRNRPMPFRAEELKMAGFDRQPDRFVGRTGVMARASAALAAQSGVPGVLLHGMPGGGKSACALELAYTHEEAFERLVWFKAPDEGTDIGGALTDFALALEQRLNGFQMIHVLADEAKLTAFLPILTELMEQSRLLIVLDNAESLLTETGQWREQWGKVITALTAHAGPGRVILTSRRVPARAAELHVESVDALSLDEAMLLARELPNLRRLIYGELPGIDHGTARRLARGVLNAAQGHPKLLELADGQAAHPDQLATLIKGGGQAWRKQGGLPGGFFATGTTTADPGDYLQVLAAWTKTATETLAPGERDLFCFLCSLEEPDRVRLVLNGTWTGLRQRLGRDSQALALDQALAAIASRALAATCPETSDENASYAIHPGVAAAGRAYAGQDFQNATDAEAATWWPAVFQHASKENDDGSRVNIGLAVRAGLAAAPYLLRQEQWNDAAVLLHDAFVQDPSRANAAAMLPTISRIAARDPSHADTLALVLLALDPAAAEKQLRDVLDAAVARGDYRAAAATVGRLTDLCRESGRLAEALTFTAKAAGYTREAGLGPWTQLSDQVQRLQVLNAMGHTAQVLDEIRRLRAHMDTLPVRPGPDEAVPPWDVREALLGTGHYAALRLSRWQDALDLGAEITASERARCAPAAEIAVTRFNDYGPMLRLGRTDEALALLMDCLRVFNDANDIEMLGNTLSALADTEDERGHGDAALRFERDALRYAYLAGDVTGIAGSYHNLGNHLLVHARQPAAAFAAHLAAAIIRTLTGVSGTGPDSTAGSVCACALDLREFDTAAEPPADIADLCRRLDHMSIPGTDPASLIARLSHDPDTAERTLHDLIARVRGPRRRWRRGKRGRARSA